MKWIALVCLVATSAAQAQSNVTPPASTGAAASSAAVSSDESVPAEALRVEATRPSTGNAGGRILTETLLGGFAEIPFGFMGMLGTAAVTPPTWGGGAFPLIVGAPLGGAIGATVGVVVGGVLNGGPQLIVPTLLGATLGGIASGTALALTVFSSSPMTVNLGMLAAMLFPVAGAVIGYEVALPSARPDAAAPRISSHRPRLFPAVSIAPDGSGAHVGLSGTF